MQETDVRICAEHDFAVQLQDQPEHAVSGGMLRTEVELYVLYGLLRQRRLCEDGLLFRWLPVDLLVAVHQRLVELLEKLRVRIPLVAVAMLTTETYILSVAFVGADRL